MVCQRSNVICRLRCVLLFICISGTPHSGRAAEAVDFKRQILPILSSRCFRCHGPDAQTREAGLRLDDEAASRAVLESGHRPIVPGNVEASQLWQRISESDPDLRMPPAGSAEGLTESERALVRAWIEQGAPYVRHWSFEPPLARRTPDVAQLASWCRGPLDRWVADTLLRHGLAPNPPADRPTLIRRVSLDLIGLPPTLDELDRFLADARPDAYERLVDRLLASPAFGERWARPWLDLARFADSAGYAQDPLRVIWRYRDWVIAAFNENKPFDQFTIEQLAGDLLPNATNDQRLATAFHRNTMTNSEGGTDNEEFRVAAVVDRVNTTMQVWMGLTMGCAQCHTHKYDPITQTEYYQVFAIFNNTADVDREDEYPWLIEYSADERRRIAALDEQIAELEASSQSVSQASAGQSAGGTGVKTNCADANDAAESDEAQKEKKLIELRKQRESIVGVRTPIMQELPAEQQRTTHVLVRGNFLIPGDAVSPDVPAAFPPLPADGPRNRLAIARWLVDPANPLTARVAVNRLWEQLLGAGLVETSEDFGLQGEPPSHPELLDALAIELVRSGWDIKQLLRTIVTSSTYRQSSAVSAERSARDAANRWLWRGPTHRLPAEMLRDQALAISGLLSHKRYGPSVRPPRPQLGLRSAFGGSTDWETSPGEDRYRRGLYTSWRRTTPYPSLTTFDAPSREVCTIRRIGTNTPLQALASLNDPVFVEAAQALARRLMLEATGTVTERLDVAVRLCTARHATFEELNLLDTLYRDALGQYRRTPEAAGRMSESILGAAPAELDRAELAAWTVVANVLLNLDEVLTKK